MYSIYMHIYIYIYMHTYAHVCARDSISIYIYIMVLSTQQNPGFFRKFTWPRPRLGDDVDHPCLLHGRYLGKDLETSADTGHGWWGKNFMTWLFRSKKVKGWGYYPWFALICGFLFSKNWLTAVQNEKICKYLYVCMLYIYHTFFYIIYIYIHFISYIFFIYIYMLGRNHGAQLRWKNKIHIH